MKIKKTGRHTGALKAVRQAHRRMLRNRITKKAIRASAKSFGEAVGKNDLVGAQKLMSEVSSSWDKAAKTGAIHWKAAARKKSRLAHALKKAAAAPAQSAAK